MAHKLPAKLEKLRRPHETIVHLVLSFGREKVHFAFVLEAPLTGVYRLLDAPCPGRPPHPSQAMLRQAMASSWIGFRRAPGLWELVFANGSILNVSFRRKARGVWWSQESRLGGALETDLSEYEPQTWSQLEDKRAASWTQAWRTKERRRIERQRDKVQRAMERDDPATYRQFGERANALRHLVRRHQTTWSIPTYDGERSDTVEDAQSTHVSELVDRLFHRAQRAERRLIQSRERLKELDRQLEQIDRTEAPSLWSDHTVQKTKSLPKGIRRFELSGGYSVLLGRNAEGNHRVTFKLARGRDLWFHLRDGAGSHVILPLNRGQNASDELVLVGAALALHYSSLRGERAEVRIAFRRDLDPVPGHPGKVLVRQERTILVDPRSEMTKQALKAYGLSLTSSA